MYILCNKSLICYIEAMHVFASKVEDMRRGQSIRDVISESIGNIMDSLKLSYTFRSFAQRKCEHNCLFLPVGVQDSGHASESVY